MLHTHRVAFAGRIRGNKRTTVGSGNFAMLFHNFGPYTHNALATRTPFSWMKNAFFNDIFKDSSEIMATSASKRNGMIFPGTGGGRAVLRCMSPRAWVQ